MLKPLIKLLGMFAGFICLIQLPLLAEEVDYAEMTLEDLMDISITSVSKREEQLSKSAAAVHVITAEDIARRGATSVPEALKLIPGVLVSQINATLYEVSIRGFRNRYMDKLLVLIDGRSIYTPFFSGVYWEQHHLPLAEVERIETIRGPGASLWGSNAVNGVINIITKSANSTTGEYKVQVQGGNKENLVTFQTSPEITEKINTRVYGHFLERSRSGSEFNDRWKIARGGSKWTWQWTDSINVEAVFEAMESENYQPSQFAIYFPPFVDIDSRPTKSQEWFFNQKITGVLNEQQKWSLRTLVNHMDRDEVGALDECRTFYSAEWQHEIKWRENHFVWGLGYRKDKDEFESTPYVQVDPENTEFESYNAFIQGQIKVTDNTEITLGTKWEDNPISGREWQPTARFAWQINENHLVWAAVSKALQTPSRAITDLSILVSVFPGALPGPPIPSDPQLNALVVQPAEDARSEELVAWELGFRQALFNQFTVDSTLFYSDYEHIRYGDLDVMNPAVNVLQPIPHNEIYIVKRDDIGVKSYGFETLVHWHYSAELDFNLGYSFIDFSYDSGSTTFDEELAEDGTPTHQAFIEMNHQFNNTANLNISVRYVDSFWGSDPSQSLLQSANLFTDLALTMELKKDIELQIVGTNLFDSETEQTVANAGVEISTEIPRSGRVSIVMNF